MAELPTTQLPEVEVTATPLPASTGLVLRIQGTDYGGWTAVRVRRDLQAAPPEFGCEVSERWPGQTEPWRIALYISSSLACATRCGSRRHASDAST
jgi:hypothetical protein